MSFTAFFILCAIQGAFGLTPQITRVDCPNDAELCLLVDFEDETDIVFLDQKYDCVFEGFFAGAQDSRVFVSSEDCPINQDSKLQVSFDDPRCPHEHFFNVCPVHGTQVNPGLDSVADLVIIPPGDIFLSSGENKTFLRMIPNYPPNGFVLRLVVIYDTQFATQFGSMAETRIQAVVGHAQTMFNFGSLQAKMKLVVEAIDTVNFAIDPSGASLNLLGNSVVNPDPRNPNLFAFLSFASPQPGVSIVAGVAFPSVVCDAQKTRRLSINEYLGNDINTAEILAHEIGHNLGMLHDFVEPFPESGQCGSRVPRFCDIDGSPCTSIGGVLDYCHNQENINVDKWSCCSNSDFAKLYLENQNNFCLAANDNPNNPPTGPTPSPPTGGCGSPLWANDEFCDDENNNLGCNFDNGACCGPNVLNNFCSQCQCLDPNTQSPTPSPPTGGCGSPQWANDEFCDDENNNWGCNFDNGACCGPNVLNNFCSQCQCLDPNAQTPTPSPPSGGCGSPQWATDKFCDDENNNVECSFDNGACCGPNVLDNFCSQCQCLDPNAGGCGSPQWATDKFCDDENNNAGCNFDNGACCGPNVLDNFCSQCQCLNPNLF